MISNDQMFTTQSKLKKEETNFDIPATGSATASTSVGAASAVAAHALAAHKLPGKGLQKVWHILVALSAADSANPWPSFCSCH